MAVELKDFIKAVVVDIAEAVSDLQSEITNGAVISPGIAKDMAKAYIYNGRDFSPITTVDFEVNVFSERVKEEGKGLGVVIKTFLAGISSNEKETEHNLARIKFSIPLSLPAAYAKGCQTVSEMRAQGTSFGAFPR